MLIVLEGIFQRPANEILQHSHSCIAVDNSHNTAQADHDIQTGGHAAANLIR